MRLRLSCEYSSLRVLVLLLEFAPRRGEERLFEGVRSVTVLQPLDRLEAEQAPAVEDPDAVGQRLSLGGANFVAALVVLAVASVSFIGIGMMTAVLPLISPEKGMQMGFIAQGILLVISGVYYSVSVLPPWMQWLSTISPATYALRGIRHAILDGYGVGAVWGDIWPLIVIGFVAIPLGLWIFGVGERHAKRHGKLKRSG